MGEQRPDALQETDPTDRDSIEKFGFTNPVLIDERRTILAGHGRLEAAKLLGMTEVPCLRLDHMSETEKRAYVLADNKLALNAGWDEDLLAAELGALMSDDLDFEIGVTGFSIPEIDSLMEVVAPEEPGNPDGDVLPVHVPTRVRLGDVWQLGGHRLICGDALDPVVVAELMNGTKAQMVFSDPPYNVPIDGHVGNSGKIQHREFAMASGEMSSAEFTAFLKAAFKNLADYSVDGSIHYLCMDWRHMGEMLQAGQGVYAELKNLIVWAKDNGGMGTFYRSRHELIFALAICSETKFPAVYLIVLCDSANLLREGVPNQSDQEHRANLIACLNRQRLALGLISKKTEPRPWGILKHNIGCTHMSLAGTCSSNEEASVELLQAISSLESSFEVRDEHEYFQYWLASCRSLSEALISLADISEMPHRDKHLRMARRLLTNAIQKTSPSDHPHQRAELEEQFNRL